MATRKATEEFFTAKGLSREAIIDRIKDGRIKGEIDGKSIMIEESEWPTHLQLKPKEELTVAGLERQKILDETERLKAEKLRLEAETQLEIAKGVLERPEKLNKREEIIEKKEADVAERLKQVELKEVELKQREIQITDLERQTLERKTLIDKECFDKLEAIKAECEQMLSECESEISGKNDEFDMGVLKRQQDIDTLDAKIRKKQSELTELQKKIDECPTLAKPLIQELNRLIKVASTHAQANYYASNRTKGKTADYHNAKANALWGLEEKFKKLLKTLPW